MLNKKYGRLFVDLKLNEAETRQLIKTTAARSLDLNFDKLFQR